MHCTGIPGSSFLFFLLSFVSSAFSYYLSSLYLRLQPTMCQHCLAAGRSPPIIANEATNKLSHSGHTARCCTQTFNRLSLFWSLSSLWPWGHHVWKIQQSWTVLRCFQIRFLRGKFWCNPHWQPSILDQNQFFFFHLGRPWVSKLTNLNLIKALNKLIQGLNYVTLWILYVRGAREQVSAL